MHAVDKADCQTLVEEENELVYSCCFLYIVIESIYQVGIATNQLHVCSEINRTEYNKSKWGSKTK